MRNPRIRRTFSSTGMSAVMPVFCNAAFDMTT
jgi:hypothetical protein